MVPESLQYTAEHEWVAPAEDEGTVRVGITDYAQEQLGDVVFVQLPTSGDTVAAGDSIAEVESTKSVSEIYAPLAGEITAINDSLGDGDARYRDHHLGAVPRPGVSHDVALPPGTARRGPNSSGSRRASTEEHGEHRRSGPPRASG